MMFSRILMYRFALFRKYGMICLPQGALMPHTSVVASNLPVHVYSDFLLTDNFGFGEFWGGKVESNSTP